MVTALGSDGVSGYVSDSVSVSSVSVDSSPSVVVSVSSSLSASMISSVPSHLVGSRKHSVETSLISSSSALPARIGLSGYSSGTAFSGLKGSIQPGG